jgi:hypothetical protein
MSVKTDLPSDGKDEELGPLVASSQRTAEVREREASSSPRQRPATSSHTPNKGTALNGPNSSESQKAGGAKVISACAQYSFCSVSMVLVNKSLASGSVPNCLFLQLLRSLYLYAPFDL